MDWIAKAEDMGWVFCHLDKDWIVKMLKGMGNDGFVIYDGDKYMYTMYYLELLVIKDMDDLKKYLLNPNLHIGDMDKFETLGYPSWYIEDFDDAELGQMADDLIKKFKED